METLYDYQLRVADIINTASTGLSPIDMMDLLVYMTEGAKMHLEALERKFPDEAKERRELYSIAAEHTLHRLR